MSLCGTRLQSGMPLMSSIDPYGHGDIPPSDFRVRTSWPIDRSPSGEGSHSYQRRIMRLCPWPQPTPQASSDPSSTGVTVRSVSVGLFFVAFINLWVTYSETVVHASRLNLSVFQLTLLATFVVLVAVINPLLSRIRASAALTEPELITVVAIAIVGAVVPASGVTGFLIGVISTPLYFASPENGWAEFYHPNLPS